MAANKASATQAQAPAAAPTSAPAGFKSGGTPEIDGWYEPREGEAFLGQILARIQITDMNEELRDVILVRLKYPFNAVQTGGVAAPLKEGQVLAVGVRHQLTEMLNYVTHRGECWVKAIGKRQLKKGRSMWQFEQAYQGKVAPPPPARQNTSTSAQDDSVPNF